MTAPVRIALAASLVLASPVMSRAQPAPLDPALSVPTTKLLAIGSFTPQASPEAWKPLIPAEMRQTAQLYLAGKLDQWFVKQDQSGVVFILNVTDPADAKAMLDPLPLGRAGFMTFQFIPLGPLSPMRTLLGGSIP